MGSVDCVVVGSGAIGCSIAWRLARAGVHVTLVDRGLPGAEASSAAAGILAGQEESHGPTPLTRLSLASRDLFPFVAAELESATGKTIGYEQAGVVSVAFDAEQTRSLQARYAWMNAHPDLPFEWVNAVELRHLQPSVGATAVGALVFPNDAQLDPGAYTRTLAAAAQGAGATLRSGVQVHAIGQAAGRVTHVETSQGAIACAAIVVAAGSWSSLLLDAGLPACAVRPLRGQMLRLTTLAPLVRGTIVSARGGYVVGRPDGSHLVGSTMEDVGFEKHVTAQGMRQILDMAFELVPALRDARVDATWANFRPATVDGLPSLGPVGPDGLYVATGHHRHGILLSAVTGLVMAQLVQGQATDHDLATFAPDRLIDPNPQ